MPFERRNEREAELVHEAVSPTAWGVAYRRTLSDIPLSKEIFEELEGDLAVRPEDKEKFDKLRIPEVAPMFEARYKLVSRIIEESKVRQVLEVAAGLSPRGVSMTQDPDMQYAELDLAGMMAEKRKIIKALIEKGTIPPRPNLRLEEGNALNAADFMRAIEGFDQGKPIAIANEGLLRYLTLPEKAALMENIRAALERFGGFWVTPDVNTKSNQPTRPGMQDRIADISKMIGRDVNGNLFGTEEDARAFFEAAGFRVERYSFTEVSDQMVSPQRLEMKATDAEEMIKNMAVYVMRVNRKEAKSV